MGVRGVLRGNLQGFSMLIGLGEGTIYDLRSIKLEL